jgi:hypothetical protein
MADARKYWPENFHFRVVELLNNVAETVEKTRFFWDTRSKGRDACPGTNCVYMSMTSMQIQGRRSPSWNGLEVALSIVFNKSLRSSLKAWFESLVESLCLPTNLRGVGTMEADNRSFRATEGGCRGPFRVNASDAWSSPPTSKRADPFILILPRMLTFLKKWKVSQSRQRRTNGDGI